MKGTMFRDGRPCEDCSGRAVQYPGVVHGCYRGSRPQSVVMATTAAVHRRRWRDDIARSFVLTEFLAERMRRHGLPAAAMVLRPHAVADPGPPAPLGRGAVFVGRLDAEKGVDLLVEAWQRATLPARHAQLTIVGDGPLRSRLENVPGVRLVGRLGSDGVTNALRAAALTVVPSRVYEGMSMVAVESLAAGRPLVVTTGGPLPGVAGPAGWPAAATPAALAAALETALSDDAELGRRSHLARERYCAQHTEPALLALLERTYRSVVAPEPA
jgi:glycosyltransferase involved in cell wall biosynthesis